MNRMTTTGLAAALFLCASATAMAQDGHGRADYGTEGEGTEESGYRNVDIYEQGRFRMRDKRDYENMIILGPSFIPPGVNVRYDRLLVDRLSVFVGAGYGSLSTGDVKLTRISGRLGANLHPIGNGMHGFFVGPRLGIVQNTLAVEVEEDSTGTSASSDGSLTTFSAGAVGGWRWIWDPGFSLSIGLGAQYLSVVTEVEAQTSDGEEASTGSLNFDGFLPAFEFTLGWAF